MRLAAGAGNDHDGGIAILGKAVLVAAVHRSDLLHRRLAGVVNFHSALVFGVGVGLAQGLVDLDHGGVQVEACALEVELIALPLADGGLDLHVLAVAAAAQGGHDGVGEVGTVLAQSLLQADVNALGANAKVRAQQVLVRTDAQQGHVGAAGQGQGAVVLQQDAAFRHFAAAQVHSCGDQCLGVAGAILVQQLSRRVELVVQRVLLVVFRGQHLAVGAQIGVDGASIGLQSDTSDHGEAQAEASNSTQATPQQLFAGLFHGV